MGIIVETVINRFDGGISNDVRDLREGKCQVSKYFDITRYINRLSPYNSTESGNDTVAREIAQFLTIGTTVYGYGVQSGTSRTKIFSKTSFTDGVWGTPANAESAALTRDTNCFVAYRYGGLTYIFGGQTNRIWKFATDGSAFTDADLSQSFTTIRQGLVHSKDDILYVPYDNFIAKNNAGSWTAAALTLPAHYTVQSITEYGNFLAIGAAPSSNSGSQNSRVWLWDRDATLTTLSESLDWGAGTLLILEELEGTLIGIGYLGKRIFIKQYQGLSGFVTIAEIESDSSSTPLTIRKQKFNDRIYFLGTISIDSTSYEAVWVLGKNKRGEWAVWLDRTANNDTAPNSVQGFHLTSQGSVEYMFIAWTDGSGDEQVAKTDDTATTFSATSIYETTINPTGGGEKAGLLKNAALVKKFIGASITTAPLPTAGQVVLKYKKDSDSAWSSAILTQATDDAILAEVNNMAAQIGTYREIRFRIESTGGAAITSFSYKADIIGERAYA